MQLNFFKKNHEVNNEVTMNDYPKLLTVQSFMVGGLVSYEDTGDGVFLLRKETLDKMMPTIEGRPVVIGHQPITLKKLEDKAVGYVTKGWFNTETGQFDCEILIKDSDVYDDIKNGNNKVSSAYQVTDLGDGGKYLGQDYEAEILDGTFTHLAIVDNPRYPDAKILINSLNGEQEMGLFNKNNDEKLEITASDTIEFNGNVYSIGELVNSYILHNEDEEKNEDEKRDEEEEKTNKRNACKRNACKRNEDKDDKDNEDEDEEKKNEDSDNDFVSKVKKIVSAMLEKKGEDKENEDKEKDNEDEEENEEEKKENRNALRLRNSYNSPRQSNYGVSTRAERIKNSNAKYSI